METDGAQVSEKPSLARRCRVSALQELIGILCKMMWLCGQCVDSLRLRERLLSCY